MKCVFVVVFFLVLAISAPALSATAVAPAPPSPSEKCPVCGMFVAKYPDWTTIVTFKDSTRHFFDGPKDLLTYYFDVKKYSPRKSSGDIVMIQVKDYYSLVFVDAQKAYYVTGSDVYGPMGNELIPFDKRVDAEEFLRDHKGKMILKFNEITPELVKTLQ